MMIYSQFLMRVMMMWQAYFQLLRRNWTLLIYPAVCVMSVIWSGSRSTTAVGSVQLIMTILIAIFIGWRFSPKQLIIGACLVVTTGAAIGLLNWLIYWCRGSSTRWPICWPLCANRSIMWS